MKKIINYILLILLCFNLNISVYSLDYLNEKAGDTVNDLSSNLYNQLLQNSPNEIFNDGYYSNYYFKNLISNFPNNTHNTCSYTALSMFLSFYDTYWHDLFIPDHFEANTSCLSNSIPNVFTLYSPGVQSEDTINSNMTIDEYDNFVDSSSNYFFQSHLISFAKDNGITSANSLLLSSIEMKKLMIGYLESIQLNEPTISV